MIKLTYIYVDTNEPVCSSSLTSITMILKKRVLTNYGNHGELEKRGRSVYEMKAYYRDYGIMYTYIL